MQTEQRSTEPAGLEALRDQIEAWRGMRPRTRSMPPPLWSEAAAMARELGVYRVARTLKLNFDTLKRHAGSASALGRRRRSVARTMPSPTSVDFVEVKGLADVSRTAVGHETIVEVVTCDGTRLSVRGACASADMAALIHAFRGRP
jgi:hypothetical protein